MRNTPDAFDPTQTYVVLRDGGGEAPRIEVTPEFWTTLEAHPELAEGRLVAAFRFDADWTSWEMHPDGDELVVLLAGGVDLVFDVGGGHRTVALRPGEAVIVPRGVWHTANVRAPSTALHVTWGRGTEHRPR